MTIQEFIDTIDENDDFRYELVKGEPIKMMATTIFHEWLLSTLMVQLQNFLKNGQCKVFGSGFSVGISEDTFRMPDISVVCDLCNIKKNDEVVFKGVPSLVIEIKSPGNKKEDLKIKKNEYQSIGIPQYWLIHNEYRVEINILRDGKYDTFIISSDEEGKLCIPLTIENRSTIITINSEEIPESLRTNILYKLNYSDVQKLKTLNINYDDFKEE